MDHLDPSTARTVPVTARAPSPSDDRLAGYFPGDFWSIPGDTRIWTCVDNEAGSARWRIFESGSTYPVNAIGGAPPAAAYGTKKLSASYHGPLLHVVNPVTSAASDIGALPDGDIDRNALWAAMSGATYLKVAVVYDQSGNDNHATQTNSKNMPSLAPLGPLAKSLAIAFDGEAKHNPVISRFLNIPPTLSWPEGTATSQLAIASVKSWLGDSPQISTLANASGPAARSTSWGYVGGKEYYVSITRNAACVVNYPASPRAPVTPFVTGYTSRRHATRLWMDNAVAVKDAGYLPAVKGGTIGLNRRDVGASLDLSALLIYPLGLSDSEQAAANGALYRHFNLAPQIRDSIVTLGDSITEGFFAALNQNWPRQMIPLLNHPYVVSNAGVFGANLTTFVPLVTPGFFERAFHKSGSARKIVTLFMGTNDLNGNKQAVDIYAAVAEVTKRAHAAGAKTLVGTILPNGPFLTSGKPPGAKEAQRLALNALIVENTAQAHAIVDVAGDPVLGDYANNNANYFHDRIHPLAFPAYSMIATHFAAAINQLYG